jgi:hypothetical protein
MQKRSKNEMMQALAGELKEVKQAHLTKPQKEYEDDVELVRNTLRNLLGDSKEAVEFMMELSRESEHPRAAEVLGQMIKQNADIAEMLLKMHADKIKIDQLNNPNTGATNQAAGSNTTNNVFIGSTDELQKMLRAAAAEDDKAIDV